MTLHLNVCVSLGMNVYYGLMSSTMYTRRKWDIMR